MVMSMYGQTSADPGGGGATLVLGLALGLALGLVLFDGDALGLALLEVVVVGVGLVVPPGPDRLTSSA
jgi:hypothetical protein